MVIPWFNPLKNNGTCLVVYEVRIYFADQNLADTKGLEFF
jgi:hypothetical protein